MFQCIACNNMTMVMMMMKIIKFHCIARTITPTLHASLCTSARAIHAYVYLLILFFSIIFFCCILSIVNNNNNNKVVRGLHYRGGLNLVFFCCCCSKLVKFVSFNSIQLNVSINICLKFGRNFFLYLYNNNQSL